MKKKKKEEMEKYRKVFIIAIIAIIILGIISNILDINKDYTKVRLNNNKKTIFTIEDLKINNLKFADNEQKIKKELGNPKKETEEKKDVYKYKKLYYDGLIITLRENYSDYILVGIELKSSKYKVSRNIKINDSVIKTMKKFKISNKEGNYIYGNYSVDSLNEKEIKDNIYIGVRDKNSVVYINRDTVIDGDKTNTAELRITYKKGKIKKIKWSYDFL